MKPLVTALLFLAAAAAQTTPYTNARFGFTVAYPSQLLIPQGEPDNGDGQRFVSKDKTFQVAAWGGHNALEQSVAEAAKWHIELEGKERPFQVTYKVVKDGWYVYSGLSGSRIIYQKALLVDGVFLTLRLEYALADKEKLDPAVKQIIASFRGPTAGATGKK